MATNPARKVTRLASAVKDRKRRLPIITRGDCIAGPRPCPHRTCRYHLAVEVTRGRKVRDTCVLDVADRGEQSGPEIGAILGLSRERIRQIELVALQKLQKRAGRGVVLALASHTDDSPEAIAATIAQAKETDLQLRERARKDRQRKARPASSQSGRDR